MPRFFVPSENVDGDIIKITGSDAYHIARSLRMAVGDEITVCDMHSNEHVCRLEKIRDEECICQIVSSRAGNTESPAEITLYMGYPKGDKLELIVQKAVELGALRIVPFESSRCVKRPKADKAEKQTARLMRIAEEAAKQCGRARLPEVCTPITFTTALELAAKDSLALFCYEGDGALSLKSAMENSKNKDKISIIVGPEGGFSLEEARAAKDKELMTVNLGPRILRCETAPLYALAAISYALEL